MPLSEQLKLDLIRRFTPILYQDRDEPSYPVSPVDYVLSCALWSSQPPDHARLAWGVADGVERRPHLERGSISLGPSHELLGIEGHGEFWLDFAGWQDGPAVAADTENRRSAGALGSRALPAALKQPWFSADVWTFADFRDQRGAAEITRLFGLGANDVPDVLERTVINFQFLFPFHREPRARTTQSPDRDRFTGDYEGDWTSFAVIGRLIDGPAAVAEEFEPLLGAFGQRWRGTLPEFEDQASLRMFLRPWSSMVAVGDHPVVIAAPGTHNLYPPDVPSSSAGTIDLSWVPFGQRTSEPANGYATDAVEQPYSAIMSAKVLAGFALGGPVGLLVGIAAAEAEAEPAVDAGLYEPPKLEQDPAPSPPGDDPLSEDAVDLEKQAISAPADVASFPLVDLAMSEVRTWASEPELALVDGSYLLSLQAAGRYEGRWGVRCADDRFSIRTGMRLPDYRAQVIEALLTNG